MKVYNLVALFLAVGFLTGCSTAPERMQKFSYEPAYPVNMPAQPQPKNGSLFQGNGQSDHYGSAAGYRHQW